MYNVRLIHAEKLTVFAYFYGPMALMLVCNLIFFIFTAIRLGKARKDCSLATKSLKKKQTYKLIIFTF